MPDQQACEIQVWTAGAGAFRQTALADLGWLLDEAERERAARFRHDIDRAAYVAAHALRRAALARSLAVDPREIVLAEQPGGRPVLVNPRDDGLFFSHSRTRDIVACAVTRAGPVGIDAETMGAAEADFEMIARFVTLTDEERYRAQGDGDRNSRFYFYWTALEAFWKAQGRGLADANPRIECRKNANGETHVHLEGDDADTLSARLFAIECAPGCSITVAFRAAAGSAEVHAGVRVQLFNGNMQLCNERTPPEMLSAR